WNSTAALRVGVLERVAAACIELLTDGEKRREMGEKGKAQVDGRFSVETMVEKIETLYEELITAKLGRQ
ncbi:MAG TPA: hypothetical protein P5287_07020, partial [bacterium]|nr:hypothetical protein [bacterium]